MVRQQSLYCTVYILAVLFNIMSCVRAHCDAMRRSCDSDQQTVRCAIPVSRFRKQQYIQQGFNVQLQEELYGMK